MSARVSFMRAIFLSNDDSHDYRDLSTLIAMAILMATAL